VKVWRLNNHQSIWPGSYLRSHHNGKLRGAWVFSPVKLQNNTGKPLGFMIL